MQKKKETTKKQFRNIIWSYYEAHGRHDLPWRKTHNPYKILVSEIMLQQTQVDRVIPKYKKFVQTFPSFVSLANGGARDVLLLWQGLGYNNRAIRLQQAARQIVDMYRGKLPNDQSILESLPGIGPYTASAVRCFSWNEHVVCIETNIRRVFLHHFFSGQESVSDKEILPVIEKMIDIGQPRAWYFALMDYGSFLKTQIENPNKKSRGYTKQSVFNGSDRQIRGKILKLLLAEKKSIKKKSLESLLDVDSERLEKILHTMIKDNLIMIKNRNVSLK
ncbi:MAG: A/G-specific adenine glycosylase [Candidatus Pacebacteria bacterium]|nr:A/G-specific adenine glycosylase [Candidatus Paceibacterota bacterium]